MRTIHYANFVNMMAGTSWANCGRLMPNDHVYGYDDDGGDGPEVSCRKCLAVMKREDAERATVAAARSSWAISIGLLRGIS